MAATLSFRVEGPMHASCVYTSIGPEIDCIQTINNPGHVSRRMPLHLRIALSRERSIRPYILALPMLGATGEATYIHRRTLQEVIEGICLLENDMRQIMVTVWN